MTRRPALEAYCQQFDACFRTASQRQAILRYLAGLLLAAERNKTLTSPAHAEPIVEWLTSVVVSA